MDRKLFGIFSGRQLTAVAITAILVPSALYGAVTYSNVAITDPATGKQVLVDASRRLSTYDPIAGYANNPLNYVRILTACDVNTTGGSVYMPPSGKALVIKTINYSFAYGSASS